MATRDIKTRLKLEGEAEYKQQLGEIEASLKTLKTEMGKVSAEYEGNANSLEALSAKNEVYLKQLETQQKKVDKLKEVLEKAAEAWGDTDKRTQAWAQKLNNAEADLYKIQHRLEDNQEAMRKLNEETDESAGLMADFADSLKEAASKLGIELPESVEKAIDKLGALDPKVSAVATGVALLAQALYKANEKLVEITENSSEYATELERLSDITGVDTQKLQEFEYTASKLGIPMDKLSDSLKDVTNKAYDAANGNEELKGKFDELGVALTDNEGNLRDSYDIYLDLIDALGEMSNQTERDATAMKLINEGARELNPLIDAGSAAITKYAEEARKMGLVMSEDQLSALTAVKDAQLEFEAAQKAVSDQMAAEYAPYMEEGLTRTKELLLEVGDAFEKSGVAHSIGSIANSVGSILEPLAEIGTTLLPPILALLDPLAAGLALIADLVNFIVGVATLPWGGGERIKTALGLNATNGETANWQDWLGNRSNETANWFDPITGSTITSFRYASGTDNFPGGLTWVGENGPELMSLPAGSQIYSAQESREMGGDVINIYISAKDTKEYNDLVAMAKDARLMARMKGD